MDREAGILHGVTDESLPVVHEAFDGDWREKIGTVLKMADDSLRGIGHIEDEIKLGRVLLRFKTS